MEKEEYTKESATLKLLSKVQNAEDESNREGWLTSKEVFGELEKKLNELEKCK